MRIAEVTFFGYTAVMKKFLVFSLAVSCGLLMLCGGCRIKDNRVHEIKVPQMQSTEDVTRIRTALAVLKGLQHKECIFDLNTRTVTVPFDSMVVAHKNIEIAIAEAGYDANTIKAMK